MRKLFDCQRGLLPQVKNCCNRRGSRQEKGGEEGKAHPPYLTGNILNISVCLLDGAGREQDKYRCASFTEGLWGRMQGTGFNTIREAGRDTAFSSSLQRRNWRLQNSKWEWRKLSSPLAHEFLPRCPTLSAQGFGLAGWGTRSRSLTLSPFLPAAELDCRIIHVIFTFSWTVHPASAPPPSTSLIITFLHHYTERSILVADINSHLCFKN